MAAAGAGGGGIQQAFEDAVQHRDFPEVIRLLDAGADPNIFIKLKVHPMWPSPPGAPTEKSPLSWILKSQLNLRLSPNIDEASENVVLKMLDKGLNPNTVTYAGGQPLIVLAITNKYKRLLKRLIDMGADLKVRGYSNKSLLRLAIETGNKEISDMIRGHLPRVARMNNVAPLSTAYVALGHGGFESDMPVGVVPPGTKVVFNQKCGLQTFTSGVAKYFEGENPEYLNPELHVASHKRKFGDVVIINEGEPLPSHMLTLFSYWLPGEHLPDEYTLSSSGIYQYPFMPQHRKGLMSYPADTLLETIDIPALYEHSIFPKKEVIQLFMDKFYKEFIQNLNEVNEFSRNRARQLLDEINAILEKNAAGGAAGGAAEVAENAPAPYVLKQDIKELVTGWRDWLQERLSDESQPIGVLKQELDLLMLLQLLPKPGSNEPNLSKIKFRLEGKPTIDEFFKLNFGYNAMRDIVLIPLSSFMNKLKYGIYPPGVFYMPLCRYISKPIENALKVELLGNGNLGHELLKLNANKTRKEVKKLLGLTIGETEFFRKRAFAQNTQRRFAHEIGEAERRQQAALNRNRRGRRPEEFLHIRRELHKQLIVAIYRNPEEAKRIFREMINLYEGLSYEEATRYFFNVIDMKSVSDKPIYRDLLNIFFAERPILTPDIMKELLEQAVKSKNIVLTEELLRRGAVPLTRVQLLGILDNPHNIDLLEDLMVKYRQTGGRRKTRKSRYGGSRSRRRRSW